ncbi:MAG TPA: hypothetical protein ENJ53_00045 [Phaeodactylibacter sp.]|nr:hypothetical protein [Phaeodactylibacter sp.]
MIPKFKRYFIFILTASILLTACQQKIKEDPQLRKERLEKAIAQKLNVRRIEHFQQCKKDAIAIAEKKVDSILLAEAKWIHIDTITKPAKPIKPTLPAIVPPKDSTAVKPLFDNGKLKIEN